MFKRVILALMLATLFLPSVAMAGTINLPQTGQATSYAAGDDGALMIGVAWPNPRFTANADQTVTDTLTDLIWTKDAGTPTVGSCTGGGKTWQAALDYVACLNTATYLGYSDWRLPNVNEIESLVNGGQPNTSAWLNSQGFTNVQSSHYWSSSTTFFARYVDMDYGDVGSSFMTDKYYVWPVRSGQSGAFGNSAIWSTGQTTTYAAGDDGALKQGVAWPNPRFTDNANNTVTDNLTGLIWTKDASTPTVGSCTGGTKNWKDALDYVACLNSAIYLGYTDWRLPNRKELFSMVDWSIDDLSVQSKLYWSSTTYAYNTSGAWGVNMPYGHVGSALKSNSYYVWPVRSGQSGSFGNLVISKAGTGTGTVTSADGKINCGSTCTASYTPSDATSVTLTATAVSGSTFTGWSGDCTGMTSTCMVTMLASKNVTATFNYTSLRFKDNGDQTLTDTITGLVWAKDAGTPTVGSCTGGTKNWQAGLDYAMCLNTAKYLGYTDWRVPTI
ncbi:secreted protein containing DUF1566, partial [Candidatus Magnetobacterium bavaricum]